MPETLQIRLIHEHCKISAFQWETSNVCNMFQCKWRKRSSKWTVMLMTGLSFSFLNLWAKYRSKRYPVLFSFSSCFYSAFQFPSSFIFFRVKICTWSWKMSILNWRIQMTTRCLIPSMYVPFESGVLVEIMEGLLSKFAFFRCFNCLWDVHFCSVIAKGINMHPPCSSYSFPPLTPPNLSHPPSATDLPICSDSNVSAKNKFIIANLKTTRSTSNADHKLWQQFCVIMDHRVTCHFTN